MREFNLEEAKAGKAICTRGGYPARIVCYDIKDSQYEILALVEVDEGREIPSTFTSKGKFRNGEDEDIRDLMMVGEKHEGFGWLSGRNNFVSMFAQIYKTEEAALAHKPEGQERLFLAKIEWEE